MKNLTLKFDIPLQKNLICLCFFISKDDGPAMTSPINHNNITNRLNLLILLCELHFQMFNSFASLYLHILDIINSNVIRIQEFV